jgi:hypothetical protein
MSLQGRTELILQPELSSSTKVTWVNNVSKDAAPAKSQFFFGESSVHN